MSDIPTKAGIYAILNETTGKIYIGSSINLRQRKNQHFRDLVKCRHPNEYLQQSFNKYSLDVFSFHVLEIVADKELLIPREQFYIDEAKSYKRANGYNLNPTAGSALGFHHSNQSRQKMSEARSGKTIGEQNPFWGKHHSDKTKAKISATKSGRKLSDEHRQKLSAAFQGEKNPMWGKHHSDQAKAKISAVHLGKKISNETRVRMSEALLNWWKQYYTKRDELQLLLFSE